MRPPVTRVGKLFYPAVIETPGAWGSEWDSIFGQFRSFVARQRILDLSSWDEDEVIGEMRWDLSTAVQRGNARAAFDLLQEIRRRSAPNDRAFSVLAPQPRQLLGTTVLAPRRVDDSRRSCGASWYSW